MVQTEQKIDICVIGGGIVGLSTALELQSQGLLVRLIDANRIGMGASFGNAGHLATEQVFPIADSSILSKLPIMLINPLGPLRIDWRYLPKLLPWGLRLLSSMHSKNFAVIHEALKQINSVSLQAWQDFTSKWQLSSWVHIQGSLLTAETQASLELLKKHGAKLNALGVSNKLLNQDELLAYEPALANNQLGAVFFPNTGHVSDLMGVIAKLKQSFGELGGQICENCKVDNIQPNSDGVYLNTSDGEMLVPKVVICSGAFSKDLVYQATNIKVPLDTERGYHLMLPQEKDRLSIPVTSMDRRFIMTPMDEGLRLAGTVEYAGLHAPPNMQRAHNLLKLATPMLKEPLNAKNATPWMGFRPSIADSLPVIDCVGDVFLNFGHQHLGLTQAAVSAKLISDLYFKRTSPIDITPYRLHRF